MANSDWNSVEVGTLSERNQELYAKAKDAYKMYKAARDAFEQAMQADFAKHLPEGQELKFGYMYGRLSVAVGDKRERKIAKGKPTQSLADWLNQQGERQ
jgi:hypothetical protein